MAKRACPLCGIEFLHKDPGGGIAHLFTCLDSFSEVDWFTYMNESRQGPRDLNATWDEEDLANAIEGVHIQLHGRSE
jgi:hypothetical protein